jgi:hypothetical protein
LIALVAAKTEGFGNFAFEPKRVLDEFAPTLRAEVESHLLINIVADLFVGFVFHAFENVLNFFKMIAIVFIVTGRRGIKSGIDLDFYDVAQILLRIKFVFAQIA